MGSEIGSVVGLGVGATGWSAEQDPMRSAVEGALQSYPGRGVADVGVREQEPPAGGGVTAQVRVEGMKLLATVDRLVHSVGRHNPEPT